MWPFQGGFESYFCVFSPVQGFISSKVLEKSKQGMWALGQVSACEGRRGWAAPEVESEKKICSEQNLAGMADGDGWGWILSLLPSTAAQVPGLANSLRKEILIFRHPRQQQVPPCGPLVGSVLFSWGFKSSKQLLVSATAVFSLSYTQGRNNQVYKILLSDAVLFWFEMMVLLTLVLIKK